MRQAQRQRDPDRAWLKARLVRQLRAPEPPTVLEDISPEIALSLLGELLFAQTRRDQLTLRWRWEAHRTGGIDWILLLVSLACWPVGLVMLFGRRNTGIKPFAAHTPKWYRLAELLTAQLGRTHSAAAVGELLQILPQLQSDKTQEVAPLEAALTRTLADTLPFLSAEELTLLPEPCWAFLEHALAQRVAVGWQQRLSWMKADFVVAALLAMDLAQRPVPPCVQALTEDREERVREAARDYLKTIEPTPMNRRG